MIKENHEINLTILVLNFKKNYKTILPQQRFLLPFPSKSFESDRSKEFLLSTHVNNSILKQAPGYKLHYIFICTSGIIYDY